MVKKYMALFLGFIFVGAGVNHFVAPEFYMKIMPEYIPAHYELVLLSGFFEVLFGLGFLFSKTRQKSGWAMILLLVAVLPANIYMAQHPELFPDIPAWGLYARLPLQLMLGIWIWWATKADKV